MIIDFKDLKNIRYKYKNNKIVICSGWFDLFHIGHLNFLKKAKENGDILIVFLRNDEDGKIIKGINRPIIKEEQRAEILNGLKCVDYVIIGNNFDKSFKNEGLDIKDNLRWKRYIPVINELNPNIVFSLKETLINSNIPKYLKSKNIKLIYTDRFEGVSTSYIEKIIKQN